MQAKPTFCWEHALRTEPRPG